MVCVIEEGEYFIEIDGVDKIPDTIRKDVIELSKKIAELISELAEAIDYELYKPEEYIYPYKYMVEVSYLPDGGINIRIRHNTWWDDA